MQLTPKQTVLRARFKALNTANSGSILGSPLIYVPDFPGVEDVQWSMKNTIGQLLNQYNQKIQTFRWPGGDLWSAKVTLPPMTRDVANPWIAFLASAQGALSVFTMYDPANVIPQGRPQGTPKVNNATGSSNLPMSNVLVTNGWADSKFDLLLPGDVIQIGWRLFLVTTEVNSDSGGNATFKIWPSIREPLTTGETIVTTYAQGLFRLAANDQTWHQGKSRTVNISFDIVEAK